MRRWISHCILVCLFILGIMGCESCKQGPPVMSSDEHEIQQKEGETVHSVSKVWPYMEEGKHVELGKDLTAKNYVLVFDGSSSMDENECSGDKTKCEAAKDAVMEWLKSVPEGANVGLVSFNAADWTHAPLGPAEKSFAETVKSIEPGGNTPLATAIKESYEMLTEQAQKQLGYGEYSIVVITDGDDNDSFCSLTKWTDHILAKTPIIIYTIGFCIDESHVLNQLGRTIYRKADNPEALRQGLKETLAEAENFDVSEFK